MASTTTPALSRRPSRAGPARHPHLDATDPANIVCSRSSRPTAATRSGKVQAGSGARNYTTGDYAYLDTAPDDTFIHMESPIRWHANGIMW